MKFLDDNLEHGLQSLLYGNIVEPPLSTTTIYRDSNITFTPPRIFKAKSSVEHHSQSLTT